MADLLECLIQLKGLRETCKRLEEMLQRHPIRLWLQRPLAQKWTPAEIVAHMADAELFFGVRVRLMLTVEHAFLPAFEQELLAARARYSEWPPLLALARFRTRREETLELLEGCSADDLARTGEHPRRGVITVADLVAIMLAHDTEHLGQARERLALAWSAPSVPGLAPATMASARRLAGGRVGAVLTPGRENPPEALMPEKIDLAKLAPADVLDLGVLIEDEARERYDEFAVMMRDVHHNREAAEFFRFMATNEERHGQQLRHAHQERHADAPHRIDPRIVLEGEAPEYGATAAFMSLHGCMETAMAAEIKAEKFYNDALPGMPKGDLRDLFAELAAQEVEHQRLIADMMAKLPPAGGPQREDVADEPVSQD